MSASVQVTFEPEELDRVRDHARQQNQTVSDWLHELAVRQVGDRPPRRFGSVEELDEFFAACDARGGSGLEPSIDEIEKMIDDSISSGLPTDV